MQNYFQSGEWNVICALCGKKMKSGDIRKRWDGIYVCPEDYERRNILDFIRSVGEEGTPPFTSPEPADQFVTVIYLQNRQGIAGLAIAGVAKAGYYNPNI